MSVSSFLKHLNSKPQSAGYQYTSVLVEYAVLARDTERYPNRAQAQPDRLVCLLRVVLGLPQACLHAIPEFNVASIAGCIV